MQEECLCGRVRVAVTDEHMTDCGGRRRLAIVCARWDRVRWLRHTNVVDMWWRSALTLTAADSPTSDIVNSPNVNFPRVS